MKKLRKLLSGAALVGMLALQTLPAFATDGMDYLRSEFQALSKISSLEMNGTGSLFCPLASISGNITGDFVTQPTIQAKGTIHGTMLFIAGNPVVKDIPFYLNGKNNQFVFYTKDPVKGWEKTTVAIKDRPAMLSMTPEEIEKNLALIKKVDILGETETTRTLQITIDGNKLGKILQEQNKNLTNTPYPAQTRQILSTLTQDITYTEKINKQTNLPESTSFDMTSLFRHTMTVILQQLRTNKQAGVEQDKIIDAFLRDSTVKSDITYGSFNKVSTITIPAEVLAAPEIKQAKPHQKGTAPKQGLNKGTASTTQQDKQPSSITT